jgi:hypothetical protein
MNHHNPKGTGSTGMSLEFKFTATDYTGAVSNVSESLAGSHINP